jgi:hypothetical protein
MFCQAVDAVYLYPVCNDQRECYEGRKLIPPVRILESWWFGFGFHSSLLGDQESENESKTYEGNDDANIVSAIFRTYMTSLHPFGVRRQEEDGTPAQHGMW